MGQTGEKLMVSRRGFLQMLGLAVGGIALEQAIPLGRVWSFPSKIAIGPVLDEFGNPLLSVELITMETLRILQDSLKFTEMMGRYDEDFNVRHVNSNGRVFSFETPLPELQSAFEDGLRGDGSHGRPAEDNIRGRFERLRASLFTRQPA